MSVNVSYTNFQQISDIVTWAGGERESSLQHYQINFVAEGHLFLQSCTILKPSRLVVCHVIWKQTFKLCCFVAEVWASCILSCLLRFLSCIKNGHLNKAISSKPTKRRLLIQEYLRLLYSCMGLGVVWFFVSRLHSDLSFLLYSKPHVTLPRIIRICFWASRPMN